MTISRTPSRNGPRLGLRPQTRPTLIALGACEDEPHVSLYVIFGHNVPNAVENAQVALGHSIALVGGFTVPPDLAGPLLTSLAQRLTPKQIAQAAALAKVFKPHKILEAGESPHGNR